MKRIYALLIALFAASGAMGQPDQVWRKSAPSDSEWVNVGNAGFSEGEAYETSLAFSPSGEPYVAYMDVANSEKATVMKFDGTSWINVGNAGFSAGYAEFTSLAFSPSGEPYVAYWDGANSEKATVMKFDGISWINVGNAGFSEGEAFETSLAFSPSGEPYVAYRDEGNSNKATVMKFDGTSWINVGNAGFSAGPALGTSLAFSPSGEPYVAYEDGNSDKATVMYYNAPVGINEPKPSQLSLYPNPASTQITIETTAKGSINIHNTSGQAILQQQITAPTTTIDVSGWKSGVYLVKVVGEKGVSVGKFIKQ